MIKALNLVGCKETYKYINCKDVGIDTIFLCTYPTFLLYFYNLLL